MDELEEVRAAKAFEQAKFEALRHDSDEEAERQIQDVMAAHVASKEAAKGPPTRKFADIRKDSNGKLISEAIRIRRSLIDSVPGLGSEAELQELELGLNKYVDQVTRKAADVVSSRPGGAPGSMMDYLASHGLYFKAKIKRDLEALRSETRLPKPQSAAGTIHISAGNASIVTVGDITNSILTTLSKSSADGELTARLTELTQAVQRSDLLSEGMQTEALGKLDFVVRQVNSSPAQRENAGIIEAVWNSFVSLISFAADVSQIASVVGPLLILHLK